MPRRLPSAGPLNLLLLAVAVLLATAAGCFSNRPLRVRMQGALNATGTIRTVLATDNNASAVEARRLPGEPGCAVRLALVDVDGLLVNRNLTGAGSLGENPVALFKEKLDAAAADPRVAAVVLRINSPGGGVTAADIMRRDLAQFRLQTGKPVVACLMDLGAGGAYYLASAADAVVAHPTTLTGGLGVILNLYDLSDAMNQNNVFAAAIRSGAKIDLGSAARTIAQDEQEILQRIARAYHDRLRTAVIESRPALQPELPAAESSKVDPPAEADDAVDPYRGTIFDGRVLLAADAQRHGLVDQIGYLDDALATARGLAGVASSTTIVFRRDNDRALTAYDITPNLPAPAVSIPFSIPGLDRSQLPVFLYLWQPEPLLERTGGI